MPRDNGRNRARSAAKPVPTRHSSRPCAFCENRSEWVDYKDTALLGRFMSDRGKIRARRLSGNCARHQREVAVAIKSARELALLPYAQRTVNDRRVGRGGGHRASSPSGGREDQTLTVGESANRAELGDIHSSELEEVDA